MIKQLLKRLLLNKRVAPLMLRGALDLHNKLYSMLGVLAVAANGGRHPKHDLIRYDQWFIEQIEPEWVVVDVGSNSGTMAARLATKARRVIGIEIAAELIARARRLHRAENLEFIEADATTLDYSAFPVVDCVTLSNVLEHLTDRVQFIRLLCDRLPWRDRKDQKFLIRVPTIERDWVALYKKELGIEYRLDRTHKIEHTSDEFVAELMLAGLRIESMEVRFGELYAVCKGAG